MKLSDYVIRLLENMGIKTIFYNSGGMIMHLVDSVHRSKIRAIHCLTEHSTICSALAYAQATNNIAVVLTTNGAGATNLLTGITASYIDSVPLLVISGECKTKDFKKDINLRSKGVGEIDLQSIMKPITKYTDIILNNDCFTVWNKIRTAIKIANTNRKGTVFLQIPIDIQNLEIHKTNYNKEFISMLKKSKRPVIIAGHGVLEHKEIFLEFIKHVKIPVVTTWRAMEILDNDNELFFGRSGLMCSSVANWIEESSDLIICLGARMDLMQTSWKTKDYTPNAKKIIIDIDINELNKFQFKALKIRKEVESFLSRMLLLEITELKKLNYKEWIESCNMIKKSNIHNYTHEEGKNINLYHFISILSDIALKDDVIVPSSSGMSSEVTQQTWKVKEGQRIICNCGLGSMGFALPHAIGASVALNRRVICIEGDGSFQYNIQELETIRRLNLNIIIFIINNNGYGSIKNTHEQYFKNNPVEKLSMCNIQKIAKAYSIKYSKVTKINELYGVMETTAPLIVEVIADENQRKVLCV